MVSAHHGREAMPGDLGLWQWECAVEAVHIMEDHKVEGQVGARF